MKLTKAQKQLLAALADGTVTKLTREYDRGPRGARHIWHVRGTGPYADRYKGTRAAATVRDTVAEALADAGFISNGGAVAGYIKDGKLTATQFPTIFGDYTITDAGRAEAARLAAA